MNTFVFRLPITTRTHWSSQLRRWQRHSTDSWNREEHNKIYYLHNFFIKNSAIIILSTGFHVSLPLALLPHPTSSEKIFFMTMMLRRCLQFPLSCASSACMLLSIRTSTRQSHGEDTLLKNVVDLRPGVPGDDELKKCSGILQRAVAHRLVCTVLLCVEEMHHAKMLLCLFNTIHTIGRSKCIYSLPIWPSPR